MTRTLSADIDISANLAVADGLESVQQRVMQRLRLRRGEWFLAPDRGIALLDALRQPNAAGLIPRLISDEVLDVQGVTGLSDVRVQLDTDTRKLYYTATVQTEHGDMQMTEEVG